MQKTSKKLEAKTKSTSHGISERMVQKIIKKSLKTSKIRDMTGDEGSPRAWSIGI